MSQSLQYPEPPTPREEKMFAVMQEMLEALEACLAQLEQYPMRIALYDKARAAISKAKGET